ncbi:MAG: DUF2723 domain-containing protein [Nitrospirae bacterium]|nr:DUF2723 domain-containing protein [Nitrospirota bacterium]
MRRYYLIFLSSFAVFIFFLTPNINTGDGGELATAAWFLGTAHPSGYPLYLIIGKTFAFLPFGNIAFRAAIISALFSSLSLTLIFWLVLKLTTSSTASLFAVTTLLVSYSYFTQSVVAKFYTLNLFLILLLFSLWAIRLSSAESRASSVERTGSNKQEDTRLLYFTMFIAGLITANHHTGIIIFGPVAAAWFFTKKFSPGLSTIFTGIALFLAGFLVNSYLMVRGSSGHFFNAVYIDDFVDFNNVLTRSGYGSSGTIASTTLFFHSFTAYWYALINFLSILSSNFSYFSYLLFLAGSVYLIGNNPKLFVFVILSLMLYGPLLAKMSLVSEKTSETDYYIVANQYFIPALSFFSVMLGAGFYQCEKMLKARELKLLSKVLPAILALFPLIFVVSRATDSNYRTDFVPYQFAKDTYSGLPFDSVIMTFGDNASYQGWYLKLVGRYREDICQIASGDQKKINLMFQGCNKKVYGTVFPMFYSQNFNEMVPAILKYRYYGTDPIKETGAYKQFLYSKTLSVDYLYLPQDIFIKDKNYRGNEVNSFLSQTQLAADKVINSSVCLSHLTDDLFSRQICSGYAIHLTNTARLYSDESYHRTGEKVKVQVRDMRSGYAQPLYTVDVTEKNRPYLELSTHILRFNKWPILYMRGK